MRIIAVFGCVTAAACAGTRSAPVITPPAFDTGAVAVDGGRIYYEVAGAGPAVVLLHGGFGDRRMWDEQFATLATEFRVVRYDHRGFGRSPAPDTAYSPVADLVRLLDHLGIARAHLVGNSMGGALALDFALVHPERTHKIVVVASGANGYPFTDADVESVMSVFRAVETEGVERAAELWLAHPMVAVASADPAIAPRLSRMIRENRGVFRMRHWPTEPLASPAYERLAELHVPVLFIVGDRDTPLVRTVAEATARRVPGSQWAVIAGADHLPQMVAPFAFNRLVTDFLRVP